MTFRTAIAANFKALSLGAHQLRAGYRLICAHLDLYICWRVMPLGFGRLKVMGNQAQDRRKRRDSIRQGRIDVTWSEVMYSGARQRLKKTHKNRPFLDGCSDSARRDTEGPWGARRRDETRDIEERKKKRNQGGGGFMRKIKTLRSLRVEMLGAFWRFTMAENRRVLHEIRGSQALKKDEYDSG